jgi:hypothetical protein
MNALYSVANRMETSVLRVEAGWLNSPPDQRAIGGDASWVTADNVCDFLTPHRDHDLPLA